MKVLVTGGAGYIGSQTCLDLLRSGFEVHVVDSLINSSERSLERVRLLSNRDLGFSKGDIRDPKLLTHVFNEFCPDIVIHFAGLKAVGESVIDPTKYYDVNVGGTAVLLGVMEHTGCNDIVFSSSATVYGEPQYLPCDEHHPLEPMNPYGRTKLVCENLLKDWSNVKVGRRAVALRYFNPVGADASGYIGEDPKGIPNNLMPYISQVAVGRREFVEIFGDDYDTIDGTGVRDYVHVADLARAHILAIERIGTLDPFEVINIGTGSGLSVLQMVKEFEKQSGLPIKYKLGNRRSGDAPKVWADAGKAKTKLGFVASRNIEQMCADTWRWQTLNPDGYLSL